MKFYALLLLVFSSAIAQEYPRDYFRPPLDIPLQLAGNFGELRNNHFHAGLDFRTQQREGLNIYASADGYVSRIKISTYGYGKAIYITHPNGYTTVYGHLQQATGAIKEYIYKKHYEAESFEIEYFPKPNELPVTKGQVIALSGNTGGSGGPHLHYEIRDSKTENVLNPLMFGFDILVPDTKKPVVTKLMVYPIGDGSIANNYQVPTMLSFTQQKDGTYQAEKIVATGKVGIGFSGYDSNNVSPNKNGIYSAKGFINGKQKFENRFESYHFDDTRYINALLDYSRLKKTGERVQKMFAEKPFPLPTLSTDKDQGIIDVKPNFNQIYKLEIADYNGNKAIFSIPIEYGIQPQPLGSLPKTTPYFIDSDKEYIFEKDSMEVSFPVGTFYNNFYLDFDVRNKIMYLDNTDVPVQKNFKVAITDSSYSAEAIPKTFIASVVGNRKSYNRTTFKNNVFTTYVRSLGNFSLAQDTKAPTISIANSIEGKTINGYKTLTLTIGDDLSGINDYKGYLNGKWILFDYDYKSRKIIHDFSDNIYQDGRNDLKIIVTDNVGNSATFETHFFKNR
ncbi:M23 family metallopeptidase [Flavobacterium ardleyense]|uniref:M23 family metallopeptidase n=1 Tax=Flavobacterium ardleyense TaxID=2038737 RepID=UPI00298CCBC0|nr:M23 family metallopeptidase [Flavobacterium ardleyense]